jgi:hypothetical protein
MHRAGEIHDRVLRVLKQELDLQQMVAASHVTERHGNGPPTLFHDWKWISHFEHLSGMWRGGRLGTRKATESGLDEGPGGAA